MALQGPCPCPGDTALWPPARVRMGGTGAVHTCTHARDAPRGLLPGVPGVCAVVTLFYVWAWHLASAQEGPSPWADVGASSAPGHGSARLSCLSCRSPMGHSFLPTPSCPFIVLPLLPSPQGLPSPEIFPHAGGPGWWPQPYVQTQVGRPTCHMLGSRWPGGPGLVCGLRRWTCPGGVTVGWEGASPTQPTWTQTLGFPSWLSGF